MSYTKSYSTNRSPLEQVNEESSSQVEWGGDALKSTLRFLLVPAVFLLTVLVLGVKLPGWALYGFAGILGTVLFVHSLRDAEWALASFALYMPLSKIVVIPIAPGINGTNIFILLLIISWLSTINRDERPLFKDYPNSKLVKWFGIISCFSAVTLAFIDGGLSYLFEDVFEEYKGWIDQFIVFFLFLGLIRDGAMARRMVIYLLLGMLVVLAMGVMEMLDKMGLSSIEKSRVEGPQLQSNDFGAFLVYSISPFIGIAIVYMSKLRIYAILPVVALYAKVLISTFSRGAYLGFAVAGLVAGYVRGKLFLFVMGVLAIITLLIFPQLIPQSILDRFEHTTGQGIHSQQMDASSADRIILWNAAIDMTIESPLLGKGFKAFQHLKSEYTERPVRVSDPHNIYLYISSQMGIPALILFLMIIYKHYSMSVFLARHSQERFVRALGIGGAAMAGGVAAINIFGSRMVNIEVCGYFWIYLAVIMHLIYEFQNNKQQMNENEKN